MPSVKYFLTHYSLILNKHHENNLKDIKSRIKKNNQTKFLLTHTVQILKQEYIKLRKERLKKQIKMLFWYFF